MSKLIFIFVVAFFVIQNVCATSNNIPDANIEKVEKLLETLSTDIQELVGDISDRLPELVKNLETNIKHAIEASNLLNIFESAKQEIEKLSTDDSATALECHEMALEELSNLNKKTSQDITTCVTQSKSKTAEVKNVANNLLKKANELSGKVAAQVDKCSKTEVAELVDCFEKEMKGINTFLKKLKEAITETITATEKVSEATVADVEVCLKILEEDTEDNVQHIIEELKTCINEL